MSAEAPKSEPQAPAKVKLALEPLKEAIAAVEEHCVKFSDGGRFNGRGTVKCARLVKRLGKAAAQSVAAVVAALGGVDFPSPQHQPPAERIRPEGVILVLSPLKLEIAAIEDHCNKEPAGEFDDRGAAQCRDLAISFGTAAAAAVGVIAQGLGLRGTFNFTARAE